MTKTVSVQPSGISFEVEPDETIFAAAWRNGFSWPTICNGQGTCRACVLTVVDGGEHLSAVQPWEREGLDAVTVGMRGDPSSYRLACQTKIDGDVVVHKAGVGPVTTRA